MNISFLKLQPIYSIGVRPEMPLNLQTSIIRSNGFCIAIFCMALFSAPFSQRTGVNIAFIFLSPLPLLLNHWGFHQISRHVLLIKSILGAIIAFAIVSDTHPLYQSAVQMVLLSLIGLPILIFNWEESFFLWTWIIIGFLAYYYYPLIDQHLNLVPNPHTTIEKLNRFAAILKISGFVFIVLTLLFYNIAIANQQKKLQALYDTSVEQNQQLAQQQEQLLAQNQALEIAKDNLQKTHQELATRQLELIAEKERVEKLLAESRYHVQQAEERQAAETAISDFAKLVRTAGRATENGCSWRNTLSFLVQKAGALQAALYINPDPSLPDTEAVLELAESFAAAPDIPVFLYPGVGWAGQSILSKEPFYLADAKQFLGQVRTGSFSIPLKSTVIFPLVHNDKLEGVLEIASSKGDEQSLTKLTPFIPILAATLEERRSQRQISFLLANSENQNQQLRQREEELRQTVRELENERKTSEAFQEQLRTLNQSLENRVRERTVELEKTLAELQQTQHQMLLSEKMAVLGQLVAGVAHEINSPLAAINASSENLLEVINTVHHKLLAIGQAGISNAFFLLLNQLIDHLMIPKAVISGREERALRKKIQQQLENMGVNSDLAADIARQLVESGFREDVNHYRELFLHAKAQAFSHLFYQIGQIRQLIENVRIAVNKTRKMVAALKNYSHSQETTEKQLIDLGEHLQTVLILYHSQMKYGIEVETDWPDNLPLVPALADELSQVWTNIIQNAIQAMNGQGRLLIKITTDEQAVFVSITDNGSGIPPDKINKIFEPFFTTKPRGQGTGLGLDICRKIIDKHGGAISVQSRPGETTFTVRLPLATVYN